MNWLNDYYREEQARRAGTQPEVSTLGAALEVSSGLDAGQALQASRVAREIGQSEELVLAAPEAADRQALMQRFNANPQYAAWVARNAVNTALAREEPEALGGIFEEIKGVAGGALSLLPKTALQTWKLFTWDAAGAVGGGLELGADAIGFDSVRDFFRSGRRYAQNQSRGLADIIHKSELLNMPAHLQGDVLENPEVLASPTYWTYQGADAIASMAPAFVASLLTRNPSIFARAVAGGAVGGFQEGSAQYTELMADEGAEEFWEHLRRVVASANTGAGSMILNTISFGKIFERLGPGAKKKVLDILESAVTEGATEWAENPLGAFWAGLARGDDAGKIAEDVWAAAKDLNVVPGSLVAGGGMRGVNAWVTGRKAQGFVDQQLAVNSKVTASKLYQQSPEKMQSLLEAAGPVMAQTVTIPRGELAGLSHGAVITEALGLTGDADRVVSLSLAELHAKLTPEAFKEVIPLAAPTEGQSLVTARGNLAEALDGVIGRAVQARDIERAIQADMAQEEARQGTEDLQGRLREALAARQGQAAEPAEAAAPAADQEGLAGDAALEDGQEAEASAPLGIGHLNAQAVESYFQTALAATEAPQDAFAPADMEAFKAELLAGMGIDLEEWNKAIATGGSVPVDLDASLDIMAGNTILRGLADHMQAESAADAWARAADLKALEVPAAILDRAGADVTPKTRAELVKRLKDAGRTQAQARHEAELMARFASNDSRIRGLDPNKHIWDVFRFFMEKTARPGGLQQAAVEVNPGVDLNQRLSVIRAEKETASVWTSMRSGRKQIIESITGSLHNEATGLDIDLSATNAKHLLNSATRRGLGGQAHIAAVRNIKELMRAAALVKSYTDQHEQEDVKNIHRFYAPLAYDGHIYAVNMLVKEYSGERSIELEGVYKLYDLKLEGEMPDRSADEQALTSPPIGHARTATGISDVILGELLEDVKGSLGDTFFQPAYHGTPHAFDKFSLGHIGSGEGAQAYGWGLYFAGDRKVAEHYRQRLSENTISVDGKDFFANKPWINNDTRDFIVRVLRDETGKGGSRNEAIIRANEKFTSAAQVITNPYERQRHQDAANAVFELMRKEFSFGKQGQLYEVNIPESEELLDWDKELGQQPEKVRQAIKNVLRDRISKRPVPGGSGLVDLVYTDSKSESSIGVFPSDEIEDAVENFDKFLPMRGESIYNMFSRERDYSDRAASEYLNSLGIKGIRYLDGTSRSEGEGNHNYVVFDDEAINILETYYQAQAQNDSPRGRTEFLPDGTINIIFTQSQDASTAIHEFAHAFRELVARTMALPQDQIADQAAFDNLKENWAAAEAWLARFDDEATLKAEYEKYQKKNIWSGRAFEDLTADEREAVKSRAKHEYFARGFEAYLLEGTAPTTGLKKLFAQMKIWLSDLYRTARGLDVELNDDVRRFFDRLLATDEELMVEGLWRGQMGLTPEDMDALRGSDAVDPADLERVMQAGDRARAEAEQHITRARNKEHEKMRRQWVRNSWAEAREHPSQQRLNEIMKEGGISLDSLYDGGYGRRGDPSADNDTIRALQKVRPGLVSNKANIGYDVWAEILGFEDSGDFIETLLNTPTLQQLAKEYVAEREAEWAEYSEMELGLTDAEIEAWDQELELWAKYMGAEYRPGSLQSIRAAIKAQADEASIDELIRLNQHEWKAKLKTLQKEIRAAGRREAKAGREAEQDDAFGEAFSGFRGRTAEAIEHLMQVKRGHVPEAFYREELGNIDLPWGRTGVKGFGLAHIIQRRNRKGGDGEAFARSLPQIIQEGRVEQRAEYPGRAYIVHEQSEAVIRLDWDGEKRSWLLTAYPQDEKSGLSSSGRGSADTQNRFDETASSSNLNDRQINIDELFKKDKGATLARAAEQETRDEFQRGVEAGYDFGVADATLAGQMAEAQRKDKAVAKERAKAKLRLMRERQEMALRYKEQTERAREIAKFEAKAKRLINQKVATSPYTKPGGIRPDFHLQMKNILAAAGLGGRPVDTGGESLAAFVRRLVDDGAPINVAPEIVDGTIWQKVGRNGEIRRRTIRSLKYEEFLELQDAIDNLTLLGRRQQMVRVGGRLQNENLVAERIIEAIGAGHEIKEPLSDVEAMSQKPGEGQGGLLDKLRGFFSYTLKAQAIALELDGQKLNGEVQNAIFQPINQAYIKALELGEEMEKGLRAVMEGTVGAKVYQRWAGEMITIEIPATGVKFTMPRSKIVMAALNCGNKQNLTALMNYRVGPNKTKMTPDILRTMLEKLNKAEWDFVQGVWDFLDFDMYPKMDALTRNTKGIPLEKVEAEPLTTMFGELRGGYFPLRFDHRLTEDGAAVNMETQEKAAEVLNMKTLFSPSEVQASSTIRRKGRTYKGLKPLLEMSVLTQSLVENIQDLAFREASNDVWRLLKRPDVKRAITGALDDKAWLQLKLWLRGCLRSEMVGAHEASEWLGKMRQKVTVMSLGAKVSVIALQVTGITQSAQMLGGRWTGIGVREYFSNPAELLLGRVQDDLYAKSTLLRMRNKQGFDRDIADMAKNSKDPLVKTAWEQFGEALFWPIKWLDQQVANCVWLGAYKRALHEGKSEAEAVMDADAVLSLTQPTGAAKDLSYAQHGGGYGNLGKLMTMFQTYFSGTQNLLWLAGRQARREWKSDNEHKAVYTMSRAVVILGVMPALFQHLMQNLPSPWPDDDDEAGEMAADIGRGIVGNLTGGLPVVKEFANSALSVIFNETGLSSGRIRNFRMSPVESALDSVFESLGATKDLATGDRNNVARKVGHIARAAAFLRPIPGGQLAVTAKGIENWDEADSVFAAIYRLFVVEPPK